MSFCGTCNTGGAPTITGPAPGPVVAPSVTFVPGPTSGTGMDAQGALEAVRGLPWWVLVAVGIALGAIFD